ncbi:MAG TPA: mycothiol synthase [Acidimicrobiales bacterium]|nr:mycothiol synthase [Acidimicrobiales bacterium]
MPVIQVKRNPADIDLPAVTELLAAATEADAHPSLGEHAWLDLVQGGREGFAGLVAWEEGHSHPVGYAQLTRGAPEGAAEHPSWALEVVVDPHHRTVGNTVAIDLVRSAIDVITSEGGGHLHLWVSQPGQFHERMAAAAGLSPGRALYQMRRKLPVDERATIKVRPFEVGRDEDAWLEVNNRAFSWHPEQGGWTEATLKAREAQIWFEPAGFLLYEQDGRLGGFCWTKIHEDRGHGRPVGEIYVVAVDPDFSGHGLGRQLTLAGLDYLSARGLEEAMLYVDATNAAAVKMYVDLGFTINHIDRAYTGDIPPHLAATGPEKAAG